MGRRRYTADFKRRVVVEAMRGDQTVQAIAARHGINPNQLSRWKTEAHDGLLEVFGDGAGGGTAARDTEKLIERLYARIGELVVERGFFFEGFRALGRAEKVRLVRADDGVPLTRKCALAGVSRASLYYEPRPADACTLALQLVVDKLYMEFPYYGTRRVMLHLRREGHALGRDKARSLMAAVGWRTIHPGPRTTKPQPGHRIYPYLLRDMDAIRPGEVWCADITYIPVRGGFFYLVAVMDWASRFVLSWELDNTMEVGFCVSAMEEALRRHGAPSISNTDQGSQFTSEAFVRPLLDAGVRISMDGKGRWMDNRFVERLWRSLKYEAVYLEEILGGHHARRLIGSWVDHYNHRRPHLAFGGRTPAEVYFGDRPAVLLAAGG